MATQVMWTRTKLSIGTLCACVLLGAPSTACCDDAANLPAEIRQVQRSLGGPVADQFQQLRATAQADDGSRPEPSNPAGRGAMASPGSRPTPLPGAWGNWTTSADAWAVASSAPSPDRRTAGQAAALRDAAVQLDASANRLESLELYGQADAMRNLAQRLRLQARTMLGAPRGPGEDPRIQAPSLAPRVPPSSTQPAQPVPTLEPTPANAN